MIITGLPELNDHYDSELSIFADYHQKDIIVIHIDNESTSDSCFKLTKEQALQLAEELIKLANEK